MGHKVFISFKTEDIEYKEAIQHVPEIDYIDKSLKEPINSDNDDYIMSKIRSEYLYDSSVTMFLIGSNSNEHLGPVEQYYIKKELQASLYTTSKHRKNGILGVVLPGMESSIYGDSYICHQCARSHNQVAINDSTTVREFNYNYYIPNSKCSHAESDRYCVLTSWDELCANPNKWIDAAYDKRFEAIANKTRVRP